MLIAVVPGILVGHMCSYACCFCFEVGEEVAHPGVCGVDDVVAVDDAAVGVDGVSIPGSFLLHGDDWGVCFDGELIRIFL